MSHASRSWWVRILEQFKSQVSGNPVDRLRRRPRIESLETRAMMAADLVVDNGDIGYAEVQGAWSDSSLGGNEGDSRFSASSNAVASFHFSGEVGTKEVFVNTPAHTNSSSAARYDIVSNGQTIGTVTLDQRQGTNGWLSLGIYNVPDAEFDVVVSQAGTGVVRADAVRAVDVTSESTEITVDNLFSGYQETAGTWQYSGLGGVSGTSRYSSSEGASAEFNFQGLADGWYDVFVNTPGHANSAPAAKYTVESGSEVLGTATLDQRGGTSGWLSIGRYFVEGGSATVSVEQSGAGVLRADAVRVVARGTAPSAPETPVDNGGTFYAETGTWEDSSLGGVDGDSRYSNSATASATFSVINLAPGEVEIGVNTPGHSNSTDAAVYTISSAGQVLGTINLDQRAGTGGWLSLGSFEITGTSLEVTVTQGGTGVLRADAMRVTPIPANTSPTTSGLPNLSLQEDAAPQYVTLFDYFSDLEDADTELTFTVVENTNSALFSAVAVQEDGQLRVEFAANANGQSQITIRATDSGGLYVESTFLVQVAAVDDPPDLVVPSAQSATEDNNKVIEGIEIHDRDGAGGQFVVTLSAAHGVLSLASTTGLTFMGGDGQSDASMTFRGTLANINAALDELTYRGNQDFFGQDSISLSAGDLGQIGYGGGLSESESIAVNVENVNDQPVIESFTIQSVNRKMVTLVGQVSDENASGLTVAITGAAAGSTVTIENGSFTITIKASQLGQIQAIVTDGDDADSAPAQVQLTNQAPQIMNFQVVELPGGGYEFTGTVIDESAEGLLIEFGGLLAGETAVVDEDNTFIFVASFPPGTTGTVTAQAVDWWDAASNVASTAV